MRCIAGTLLLLAACAGMVSGAAVVHVARDHLPPQGWRIVGPASGDEQLSVHFAVGLNVGAAELETMLMAVSDPASPQYGQHLTLEQLAERVHARPEALEAVQRALAAHGLRPRRASLDNGFLVAEMSAAAASRFFGAAFHVYEHAASGARLARALGCPVPAHLQPHLDFVLGHNSLPSPRDMQRLARRAAEARSSSSSKSLSTDPSSINDAYQLQGYVASNPKSSQAVAGFLKQYFSPDDLTKFQKEFNLPVRPIDKVIGPDPVGDPGLEANLDTQYIGATGRNISTWFVSIAKEVNHGQEAFLTWAELMLNTSNTPYIHSVSYGDVEASIPLDYRLRLDQSLMQMGIVGKTIFVSAGDSGVSCSHDKFAPDWPTCCPYVTSVGGTQVIFGKEHAWSDGGGGFSNTYAMPSWQTAAVKKYLSSGVAPSSSYFNASGRAYPDIAGFATDFQIVYDSSTMPVDGTSCSSPTVAGLFASLNDVRFNANKAPLGFLNPLLYQLESSQSSVFTDITKGSNPSGSCPGFEATAGWDPTTGVGSPLFAKLRNAV